MSLQKYNLLLSSKIYLITVNVTTSSNSVEICV